MSGGHFDYSEYRIKDIADEIKEVVRKNASRETNKYGDPVGYGFSKETIKKFKQAVKVLERAYIMAHRIDYLLSSDDGEESFHERWDEELKINPKTKSRNPR